MSVVKRAVSWSAPTSRHSSLSTVGSKSSNMESASGSSCVTNVLTPPRPENQSPSSTPEHHKNKTASKFANPWKSFNPEAVADFTAVRFLIKDWDKVETPGDVSTQLPVQTPNFDFKAETASDIKATWLGHACFLVELPAPRDAQGVALSTRGPRILFDPVFSAHCASGAARVMAFGKTRRHTAAPAQVKDLEGVDMVMISHNHMDHLDEGTLQDLQKRFRDNLPHYVLPLNNEALIRNLDWGGSQPKIHSLDWWQSRVVVVQLPCASGEGAVVSMAFEVTCVPSQHQSNRSLIDRNEGLWAGFAVTSVTRLSREALLKQSASRSPPTGIDRSLFESPEQPFSCYFAGDTGYAYSTTDELGKEVCPAFKEIGERFGGFDLSLLPIGAYDPRTFTSGIHSSPLDAAMIFKDTRSRRALAMHWGTFALTNEPLLEPRDRLPEACKQADVPPGLFTTVPLGSTTVVQCTTSPDI
ncbi:Metallo-hydrolase/oxidoreductase [Clavulina sp. PMI_390]|nr:Metallo-hydrolase/oxidoreductase [Clavulina sp. PMI_390]